MEWIHFVKKENYTSDYFSSQKTWPVCTWNEWRKVQKKWDIQEDDLLFVFENDQKNYKRIASPFEKHCTHVLMSDSGINQPWSYPVLKKYIHPGDEVCVLAFSFYDEVKTVQDWNRQYKKGQGMEYAEHTNIFFKFGLKESQIHWVNYFTDSKAEMEAKIEKSNILLLTGGAPDLMMKRIKEFKLKPLLKNYQGLMIGYSAGAMIQLDTYHITPDDDYPQFGYKTGLGCLQGFAIEPHYHGSKIQNQSIETVRKEKQIPVYGIYEKGGILVKEGKLSFFGQVERFE